MERAFLVLDFRSSSRSSRMSSSIKSGGQRLGDSIRIWLIAGRNANGLDESEGLLGGELVRRLGGRGFQLYGFLPRFFELR